MLTFSLLLATRRDRRRVGTWDDAEKIVSHNFGTLVVVNFCLAGSLQWDWLLQWGLPCLTSLEEFLAGMLSFIPYLGPARAAVVLFVIGPLELSFSYGPTCLAPVILDSS